MSPRMLRPSRFLSITVMFCVLVTLTGCPRGKDLPSRIDNGFEVTAGSTLLGAVFADTDGWTAYSNISGDPVAVWNDFAKRSRSFTFRSIGDARSSCSISGSRLVCRAASHPEGSNTEAILVSMTYGVAALRIRMPGCLVWRHTRTQFCRSLSARERCEGAARPRTHRWISRHERFSYEERPSARRHHAWRKIDADTARAI